MFHVKISSVLSVPPFIRQLPNHSNMWGDCIFHVNDSYSSPDVWCVFDNLPQVETAFVNKKNVFLFTGEPPFIKLYSYKYTNQFGKVFSCQKNVYNRMNGVKMFPLLPWMAGARQIDGMNLWDNNYCNYDFFKATPFVNKLNKIAIITSNKMSTKGHLHRILFAKEMVKAFPDYVDLYGNGFSPIADKLDIYARYKYVICIENCSYSSYWTEKLSDVFLCESFPLYYGAPDIEKYFPPDSFMNIDIFDYSKSANILRHVLNMNFYEERHEAILKAKQLVLNKYNLFCVLDNIVKSYISDDYIEKDNIVIDTLKDDFRIKILRRLHKYFQVSV